MKYLQGRFSVAVGGKEYRDGWDAIFAKKEPSEAGSAPERADAETPSDGSSLALTGEELADIDREARRVASSAPVAQGVQLPGGGIRMPRGSTPQNG